MGFLLNMGSLQKDGGSPLRIYEGVAAFEMNLPWNSKTVLACYVQDSDTFMTRDTAQLTELFVTISICFWIG